MKLFTEKLTPKKYIYIFSFILLLDIITIISNIYIAPVLDNYGMPDVLIYIKLVFTIATILVFYLLHKELIVLPNEIVNTFILMSLLITFSYFLSLFVYKHILISDTQALIQDKILAGGGVAVLDVSRRNSLVLKNILAIYGGANSELFLFAQGMLLQYAFIKQREMDDPTKENKVIYDDFLYERLLPLAAYILSVTAFLSINLFSKRFDLLGAFEMAISLAAFAAILPPTILMHRLSLTKNDFTTTALFKGTHKYMLVSSIITIVLFTLLIGINITLIALSRGSYRISSSVISLALSIFILVKTKKVLSLENK